VNRGEAELRLWLRDQPVSVLREVIRRQDTIRPAGPPSGRSQKGWRNSSLMGLGARHQERQKNSETRGRPGHDGVYATPVR
jgi:hypothetical protein